MTSIRDLGQTPIAPVPRDGEALARSQTANPWRSHGPFLGLLDSPSSVLSLPLLRGPSCSSPSTHLAPDKLSQPDEYAPQPLVQLQRRAAERFPAKLHDHYLEATGAERETEGQAVRGQLGGLGSQGTAEGLRLPAALGPPRPGQGGARYLDGEGAQHNGAEDGVPEDAVEDVALAVDLAGVDLVEELHHDEGVEDDGVVLGGWRVQGRVPPAVDLEHLLACQAERAGAGLRDGAGGTPGPAWGPLLSSRVGHPDAGGALWTLGGRWA